MEERITSNSERFVTTLVNDVEHIESQSLNGIAVVKIYFQPNANIQTALAQTTAIMQTILRTLPPGATPPLVAIYSASTVPVIQIGLTSESLSEQALFDFGNNFIRTQLATVRGVALPFPYGGKQRQIQVDLDPQALQSKGLSPVDIVNAVNAQNLILPTGTAKLGTLEYTVEMNGSPQTIAELNDLPVKTVNGATIYMREVAHIRDGFLPQTNIVRANGQRGVLMSAYKTGSASTLDMVNDLKATLNSYQGSLPEGLKLTMFFDQSLVCARFDRRRLARSPDRRLPHRHHDPALPRQLEEHAHHRRFDSSLDSRQHPAAQRAARNHQYHDARWPRPRRRHSRGRRYRRNRKHQPQPGHGQGNRSGDPRRRAANRHSRICFHALHLHRVFSRCSSSPASQDISSSRSAEAVSFAMLASYMWSRTIVPTMAMYLLSSEDEYIPEEHRGEKQGFFRRYQQRFEHRFEQSRDAYRRALRRRSRHVDSLRLLLPDLLRPLRLA